MKLIVKILLFGLLIGFSACKSDLDRPDPRPRSAYMLDVCFMDEAGNYLLDKLDVQPYNEFGYAYIEPSQYSLFWTLNGDAIGRSTFMVGAHPASGTITFPFSISHIDLTKYSNDPESVWVYQINFTCPKLYGNDREHILVLEQKKKNSGLLDNFERLFYDGELIATDAENEDDPRVPFVIVVPQK